MHFIEIVSHPSHNYMNKIIIKSQFSTDFDKNSKYEKKKKKTNSHDPIY